VSCCAAEVAFGAVVCNSLIETPRGGLRVVLLVRLYGGMSSRDQRGRDTMGHTEGFGETVGLVVGLIEVLPLHRRSALKCLSGLLACGESVHEGGS